MDSGLLIAVISLIVCTSMLIIAAFSRILQEIKNYSIYILIGIEKSKILFFSILEVLIIFIPANLISFCVFSQMYSTGFDTGIFDKYIIIAIALTEMMVIIISTLITTYKIKSINLSGIIRRKE